MNVTEKDAKDAVLTLIKYISKNTANAEVLRNTPSRVIDSFSELFSGYSISFDDEFDKHFENNFQYQNIVMLDSIVISSTCEHHLLPIRGFANIAYIPNERIIGLSKICRIVEAVSRKLQLQERMTQEILNIMEKYIKPKGCAVHIIASHDCMSLRGIKKENSKTTTILFSGEFETNLQKRNEFLQMIKNNQK